MYILRLYVSADQYPEDVIDHALKKQNQTAFHRASYSIDDYVLKIVGREEYLLPDSQHKSRPLYKYTYIYKKIMKGEAPKLVVLQKCDVTSKFTSGTYMYA